MMPGRVVRMTGLEDAADFAVTEATPALAQRQRRMSVAATVFQRHGNAVGQTVEPQGLAEVGVLK